MKVKLDDKYTLNSDAYCYWISKRTIVQKGKTAGQEYEQRISGYAATIEQAIESFSENSIRLSEATTLNELREDIVKLRETVKSWEGKYE